MDSPSRPDGDARTRRGPGAGGLVLLLLPALAVIWVLFGGGLALGLVQALGYLPGAGLGELSWGHFVRVLSDPDFFRSLLLTFYIAGTSTSIAAGISILTALLLASLVERSRVIHFIFQVPLTVPHLVIAVAVVFMLAPAGLFPVRQSPWTGFKHPLISRC
jgi:putative spermidine/putrescine transport system permease protein